MSFCLVMYTDFNNTGDFYSPFLRGMHTMDCIFSGDLCRRIWWLLRPWNDHTDHQRRPCRVWKPCQWWPRRHHRLHTRLPWVFVRRNAMIWWLCQKNGLNFSCFFFFHSDHLPFQSFSYPFHMWSLEYLNPQKRKNDWLGTKWINNLSHDHLHRNPLASVGRVGSLPSISPFSKCWFPFLAHLRWSP